MALSDTILPSFATFASPCREKALHEVSPAPAHPTTTTTTSSPLRPRRAEAGAAHRRGARRCRGPAAP